MSRLALPGSCSCKNCVASWRQKRISISIRLLVRVNVTEHGRLLTREADLKHHSLLPVFDGADGGELVFEQEEEGARQQAHQAHEHTVVARVRVLVEDTVETLAAQVDITLVHDGGKHHQGKYLRTGGGRKRERGKSEIC